MTSNRHTENRKQRNRAKRWIVQIRHAQSLTERNDMKQPKPTIHPNACKKLARYFRQVKRETGAWNIRETARRLDVNQKYVHDNLIHGIEPTDTTESGRETRRKIFLKEYKPKPRVKKEAKPVRLPAWLEEAAREWFIGQRQKVNDMARETREEVKRGRQ